MNHPTISLWVVPLFAFVLVGCQDSSDTSIAQKPPSGPSVVAATAIQHEIREYSDFSGTVSASEVVEIRARVEGFLLSVAEYTKAFVASPEFKEFAATPEYQNYRAAMEDRERAMKGNRTAPPLPPLPRMPFSPDGLLIEQQDDFEVRKEDGKGGAGSIVDKGTLLFVIDPKPFEVALEAAKAKITGSKARLALAEENLKRYDQLLRQEAVTTEEYQRNKASRDVALATVLTDEAAIRDAEINLSYTIMRAPFTGRVDRRYVDPGNLVGGLEKTLLTTIRQEDPMQVYFDVSEKIVLELLEWRRENADQPRNRYEVFLKLANETDFVHKGYLDYLENQVDPSTGTALIRAIFPNQNGHLYDGLNVMVRVPGDPVPDAVLVHEAAIGTDLGGKYVVIVEKNDKGQEVARFQRVELGTLHGEMRVILDGVEPGQQYVYEGLQRVRDGSPVSITETADLSSLLSPAQDKPPAAEATSPEQPEAEAESPAPSTVNN